MKQMSFKSVCVCVCFSVCVCVCDTGPLTYMADTDVTFVVRRL